MKYILVVVAVFIASLAIAEATDLHKGGTASDVAAIKKVVSAANHGAVTDWFIAIDGNNAVASWAQGPGWGESDGFVKTNGMWAMTCRDNAKGHFGDCKMSAATYKRLINVVNHLGQNQ